MIVASRKHPIVSRDMALSPASVFSKPEGDGAIVRVPLDDQALRISIDDGRGKPRMVSLPTVSFGSQRLMGGNSFVPVSTKGVW